MPSPLFCTMRTLLSFLIVLLTWPAFSQSVEVMPGTERVFTDVQFIEPVVPNNRHWTLFSRTRSTLDYNNANLFQAGYFSYTSNSGLGGSVVGSISTNNGGGYGAGVNYFKHSDRFSLFILVAMEVDDPPNFSWFSIARYTPPISEKWKGYAALELFNLVGNDGHLISVQRARLGAGYQQWQFGLAANLTETGNDWEVFENYGIFLRKTFN